MLPSTLNRNQYQQRSIIIKRSESLSHIIRCCNAFFNENWCTFLWMHSRAHHTHIQTYIHTQQMCLWCRACCRLRDVIAQHKSMSMFHGNKCDHLVSAETKRTHYVVVRVVLSGGTNKCQCDDPNARRIHRVNHIGLFRENVIKFGSNLELTFIYTVAVDFDGNMFKRRWEQLSCVWRL